VRFYARAFDIYGQAAQSQTFTVFLEAAPGATPPSSGLTISGRWRSELATGTFSLGLMQIGNALRGSIDEIRVGAGTASGFITAGYIQGNHVTLTSEFDSTVSMMFDCTLGPDLKQLVCQYADTRGRTGSAIFQRVE
jgi:hypothetical protein